MSEGKAFLGPTSDENALKKKNHRIKQIKDSQVPFSKNNWFRKLQIILEKWHSSNKQERKRYDKL